MVRDPCLREKVHERVTQITPRCLPEEVGNSFVHSFDKQGTSVNGTQSCPPRPPTLLEGVIIGGWRGAEAHSGNFSTGWRWERVRVDGTGEPQWPNTARARINMRTGQARTLDRLVGSHII